MVDTGKLSDEQLAAEAARESSDGPAFVALVDRFQPRVWQICYRLLSNAEDAADAAQEVFVRLFLQRDKFAGRSKYSTWVHGIAVRTCLSLRRGRGRRRRHEDVAADAQWESRQPARAETAPGLSLDLARMLETLDEEDRALLIMKYAQGCEYDELADIFELSVSACKMRISRAREKLQARFAEGQPAAAPPRLGTVPVFAGTMRSMVAKTGLSLLTQRGTPMSDDILEQLSELEVAAPPPEFNRRLHDRVNRCLLWQQLLDLALGALPWALLNFVRSLAGFAAFTVTGRFAGERKEKKKPGGP